MWRSKGFYVRSQRLQERTMLSRLNKTGKFNDNRQKKEKKKESKLATVDPFPSSIWVNTNLRKFQRRAVSCRHEKKPQQL